MQEPVGPSIRVCSQFDLGYIQSLDCIDVWCRCFHQFQKQTPVGLNRRTLPTPLHVAWPIATATQPITSKLDPLKLLCGVVCRSVVAEIRRAGSGDIGDQSIERLEARQILERRSWLGKVRRAEEGSELTCRSDRHKHQFMRVCKRSIEPDRRGQVARRAVVSGLIRYDLRWAKAVEFVCRVACHSNDASCSVSNVDIAKARCTMVWL